MADHEEFRRHASRVIAAYVRDRAHQYTPSSGVHAALCDLAGNIRDGEAWEAFDHGELDDLMKEPKKRRRTCRRSYPSECGWKHVVVLLESTPKKRAAKGRKA